MTSEGQRQLAQSGLGGSEIATLLGLHKSAVSKWLSGHRKPLPDKRREIEALLKIPTAAWDQLPQDATLAVERPGLPVAPPAIDIDVTDPLGSVRALIAHCQHGMRTQGLGAAESKAWQDRLLNALKLAQHLQHAEEVREDMIARTPAFKRLCALILDALAPYPEALGAVVAQLERAGV